MFRTYAEFSHVFLSSQTFLCREIKILFDFPKTVSVLERNIIRLAAIKLSAQVDGGRLKSCIAQMIVDVGRREEEDGWICRAERGSS